MRRRSAFAWRPSRSGTEPHPERRQRALPARIHRRPAPSGSTTTRSGRRQRAAPPTRRDAVSAAWDASAGRSARPPCCQPPSAVNEARWSAVERARRRPALELRARFGVLAQERQHLDPPGPGGVRFPGAGPTTSGKPSARSAWPRRSPSGSAPAPPSPTQWNASTAGLTCRRDPAQLDLRTDRRGCEGDGELDGRLPGYGEPRERGRRRRSARTTVRRCRRRGGDRGGCPCVPGRRDPGRPIGAVASGSCVDVARPRRARPRSAGVPSPSEEHGHGEEQRADGAEHDLTRCTSARNAATARPRRPARARQPAGDRIASRISDHEHGSAGTTSGRRASR